MKPVHVCVPVLRRYDLLQDLCESLRASTVRPELVHVIDNGCGAQPLKLALAVERAPCAVRIYRPSHPLGVAESWNWFILHVPDERVIANDDITFGPQSLERMQAMPQGCVVAIRAQAFSCFLLRDACISAVARVDQMRSAATGCRDEAGLFDEAISPGYGYFEDCDYNERLKLAGLDHHHCEDSQVVHVGSATLKSGSAAQQSEHHRRFLLAQENFYRKWRRMPPGVQRQRS